MSIVAESMVRCLRNEVSDDAVERSPESIKEVGLHDLELAGHEASYYLQYICHRFRHPWSNGCVVGLMLPGCPWLQLGVMSSIGVSG